MPRRRALPAALALLFAAGCGGGGTYVASVDHGGGYGPGGATVVVVQHTAVVAADLDGDGVTDLAALGRDGSGPGLVWRHEGGAFVAAPPAWEGHAGVLALQDDADTHSDAELASALGLHRTRMGPREDLVYAVLHVGEGADAEVAGPPSLQQAIPPSAAAGAFVLLRGADLAARGQTTTVTFGGLEAEVHYAFAEVVIASLPQGLPAGWTEVRVVRGGVASEPLAFEVRAPSTPDLVAASPTTLAPGALALLSGTSLGTPSDRVRVQFSGAEAVAGLGLFEAIVVRVPEAAVSGPVFVTVNGSSSGSIDVEVGSLPAPVLASLTPTAASPGSLVRIDGADVLPIDGGLHVHFGALEAAVYSVGPGHVVAIVPPGATDGDVVVSVGGRTSNGRPFEVLSRGDPTITAIEPEAVAPGSFLEISGRDLVDLSAWRPGALPARPAFGDLAVTVGGAQAVFVLPTVDGLLVVVPQAATTGTVRVELGGRTSNAFPVTVR